MEFFALLTASTIVIIVLAILLFIRRRDPGIVLGIGALYYWSLFGAWYIVIDKTGGFSGKYYQYLETKLFAVSLDNNYLMTLALYAGFIVLVELTLLLSLSRDRPRHIPRLMFRHEPILIIGLLAAFGSIFIIKDKLTTAWALNTSAYWYTRTDADQWFTLHQVLNRVAMIPPAIGLATLLCGDRSRFFVNVERPYTRLAYVLLFAVMGTFTFILGNKNEVLVALLAGFLTYLASVRRPRYWKAAIALVCGFWFLYTIDYFRSVPFAGMETAVTTRWDETTGLVRFVTSSNEAYAAHFSMYAVLASNTPPRFGYSIYSLACSVIPRILWPNRPKDIYLYYSESIGAIQNQGYSLHHATGWYLNFGYAGVGLGALVMGLVWAWTLNAHQRLRPSSGLPLRLIATVTPWLFIACLPPLVRAGPEGYKGFVIEGVLIPMFSLLFACRPPRKRKPKLIWNAERGWELVPAR